MQRLLKVSEMAEEEDKKAVFPFHEMGLDDRVLKAIARLGWVEPTLIQERAVPLILEGKDLLARWGRTPCKVSQHNTSSKQYANTNPQPKNAFFDAA